VPAELASTGARPDGDAEVWEAARWVLGEIRRAKTDAKHSMRAPVERVLVRTVTDRAAALRLAEDDLKEAGGVANFDVEASADGADEAVEVRLARG
jgi:valyl-tRNA synthetase